MLLLSLSNAKEAKILMTGADFMPIISQIGMLILICFIILLIRESNKNVKKASEEGENFEDEWTKYQKLTDKIRKEEIKKLKKENIPSHSTEYTYEDEVHVEMEHPNLYKIHQAPSIKTVLVRLDENHYPTERIDVNTLPFTIGRGKQNSLVLEDLCVAREHCQLIEKSGKLILKDKGTANKIYADGKLHDEVELYDRLRFYIGNEEFLVELDVEGSYGNPRENKKVYKGAY